MGSSQWIPKAAEEQLDLYKAEFSEMEWSQTGATVIRAISLAPLGVYFP